MHSSGRLSSQSSGSNTFSNIGSQIMGSTKIPTGYNMACDYSEDFFLGSPKKREQHQYETNTNDSTPEKDFHLDD